MCTINPNLINMPEVVINEILEKLDLRNIITLRKVCKSLLSFIDSQNSLPELIDLSIFVNFEKIEVWYYHKNGLNVVGYCSQNNRNDTKLVFSNLEENSKILKNQNYFTSFLTDFKFFISRQNFQILRQFRLTRYECEETGSTVFLKIFEDISKILKSKPRPLSVEELLIGVVDDSELIKILEFLNSKNLKSIKISSNSLKNQSINSEEIEKLDQWKSAKNLSIDNFILEISLEKLLHFSFLDVKLEIVDARNLLDLKNKFLESTDPKEFVFTFVGMKNQEKILEFFGTPEILKNIFGQESQRWKLQYPGNEKILEIQICKNWCKFTNIESLEEQVRRRREEAEQLENSGN
ncbi:Protein CBR-FBXA-147 [Caenorhabditis briggsae]|uniref:Protein CBR-FBXA-147 n=2 Tax=Caenorhabditis briggsae TaxID=6238 RepID=A8XTQ3_CAEBR|nr:Protein CBR-FBXA-147 [Caenorhabditis briggsae]UMM37967.1 hypothetical protein L5515_009568 [Caenorhabditis briggsae]CAP36029.1 Protein CBR-FBXA-147 [Caenorhabditis briggsae]